MSVQGEAEAAGSRAGRVPFAEGGAGDVMIPCAELAGLTGEVLAAGAASLSDDELVGVMRAARRVQSWQAAAELACAAELAARREAAPYLPPGAPHPAECAAAELAVALTLTGAAAADLVGLAQFLALVPDVAAALARGSIDLARARVFTAELSLLSGTNADAARSIAARLVAAASGWTTGQLRARLQAEVLAVDPQALRRRQQRARQDARVEVWPEGSGNAALAARELPRDKALLADRNLTALARALIDGGMAGTLEQVRAAVCLALISGQQPGDLLAEAQAQADVPAGTTGAGDPAAAVRWPSGLSGVIQLTMPFDTWAGLADRPGQVAGYGPADAFTCRDLAAALAGRPGARYCLIITTPHGQALGHAHTRTPPPGGAGPPGGGPPGRTAGWIARLKIDWLRLGDCDHRHETPGYRPGRLLEHLVKIRNPTCTAPGCRRPSQRADLDHVVAYDQGGRTDECNVHPGCRRHHRLKGSSGWHLEMPRPGILQWTLPHGRTYTTVPAPYPV